ncbi:MAG: cobalt ECF transporter T component CbiQ [Spirochaetes bacterium]|nr:cobalt ECF transporter T component CbiQ [Spirochaetota bacterium]
MTFIDRTITTIAGIIKSSYVQWETAGKNGLFQKLDPRVKVLFLVYFIVIVSLMRSLAAQLALAAFVFIVIAVSRLDVAHLYRRIAGFAFFFGFLIALPSAFNVITPGEIVLPVAELARSHRLWIYAIPKEIGLTAEGCFGVAMLTLRVANSVGLSLLVIHTTPFFEILRALKMLRVPDTFLMIIILSYKYIFIFSRTVEEMYLAMKSRLVGPVDGATVRGLIAGRIFLIFKKSQTRYEETYRAMVGRGFTGDIILPGFPAFSRRDVAAGLALALVGAAFLVIQHFI